VCHPLREWLLLTLELYNVKLFSSELNLTLTVH
jgi:hypothetical protein